MTNIIITGFVILTVSFIGGAIVATPIGIYLAFKEAKRRKALNK